MRLYNTLSRRLEEFVPRRPGEVAMYVCGPTVQSSPHLGHGRAAVVFDVMRRYFEWCGLEVTFVMNVTDIDDKIIAEAQRRGISTEEVATESGAEFFAGYRALSVREATVTPYATEHVDDMVSLIDGLIESGHAYQADGDVYFSVRSFRGYGKLSGRDPDELLAGARVEPGEGKHDPLDFALWKAAKPGEPSWESPWGPGRPGWHIECSAMSSRYLGHGFDIHGGGLDLIFPHHENEIAQSEAATGEPFVRYWLHNGMVNLSGEKMAKSTGRLIELLEAVDEYPPLAVRLFYLRKHYRAPVDFSPEALDDAAGQLERLWSFRRRMGAEPGAPPDPSTIDRFRSAMDDDFNTAVALAALFDAVGEGNRALDAGDDAGPLAAAYDEIVNVLGLAEPALELDDIAAEVSALAERMGVKFDGRAESGVQALLRRREEARAGGDYATADAVRDQLSSLGIVVEDTPDGPHWHRR